jgi:hypothetical protein
MSQEPQASGYLQGIYSNGLDSFNCSADQNKKAKEKERENFSNMIGA